MPALILSNSVARCGMPPVHRVVPTQSLYEFGTTDRGLVVAIGPNFGVDGVELRRWNTSAPSAERYSWLLCCCWWSAARLLLKSKCRSCRSKLGLKSANLQPVNF